MSFRHSEGEPSDEIVAEINVTPLTDIFLVLLIIFMVTSTALVQQGQPVNLPQGRGDRPATPAGVTITLTEDRRLSVDGRTVSMQDLEEALGTALRESAAKNVVLQGDRHVVLEDAVRIMSIAKLAGAEKIAIATQPDTGGSGR